jgi:outer membrane protein TolC
MSFRTFMPFLAIVIVIGMTGCKSNRLKSAISAMSLASRKADSSGRQESVSENRAASSGEAGQTTEQAFSRDSVVPASMSQQSAEPKFQFTTAQAVAMATSVGAPIVTTRPSDGLPPPAETPSDLPEELRFDSPEGSPIENGGMLSNDGFDASFDNSLVVANQKFPAPTAGFDELPTTFWEISLIEVVTLAISDQAVLRTLSGEIVRNPASAVSGFDPAIQRSNANFGVDAALSQFDPVVTGSGSYAKNDDFFNNPSTTANAAEVKQDLTRLSLGVNKVNQYGTLFSLGQNTNHDSNNNPTVFFPHSWDNAIEATVRQPLMQGRGRAFNRIAGPDARPGFLGTSGVEISLIDNQIEYARFERGLREYVLELVNNYWQLDLAYRNYDVIRQARDSSFEIWQATKAKFEGGLPGGEADREAQARAQYYQFEQQLDQALNAVQAGQTPGVLQAEANLRRLMNLPQSGGLMLRPSDEPSYILPSYDWENLSSVALGRREELRQQRQRVQRANMLVVAAKNFTLPRLDALATYRLSGLGDDLIGSGGKFAGALNETWNTNYEEYEFGVNYEMPVGQRRALAGLRNARLQSIRETTVLEEMEQQIVHDLGSAYRGVQQTEKNIQLAEKRRDAARDTFQARKAAFDADAVGFEDLLESQRFYLDAELALHDAKTQRERAIYQLASEGGTLLTEFQIRAR